MLDNLSAARSLFQVAALLEFQQANPFRVRAYRRAAVGLLQLADDAARHTTETKEMDLPWLGPRLRRKVGELVVDGRMQFQDEVERELPRPIRALIVVPGIGPRTAARLVNELGITTVRGVARAAARGRLQTLRGIGPTREGRLGEAACGLLKDAA
jgi:DNA polymerase (family 10)